MYDIVFRCFIFYIVYLIVNNSNMKLFYVILWTYSIINYNDPLINYIVSSVLIYIFYLITRLLEIKSFVISKYTDNNILINNGIINFKVLDKLNYGVMELIKELNNMNIKDISDVLLCSVSNNKLNIVLKSDSKPITLILDGKINYNNLSFIKKDRKWIYELLNKKKVTIDNVNYAFLKNNKCFIIKN